MSSFLRSPSNSTPRVFIVIPDDYAAGGLQRSALAIRAALHASDYEVLILCTKLCLNGYASKFSFIRSISSEYGSKLVFWIIYSFRMLRIMHANHGSVFISLGLYPSLLLAILSFGPKRWRLIASERIYPPMESHSAFVEICRRLLFHRFDFIVGQSAVTLDWFHNHLALPIDKLVLIQNPIYPPKDTTKRAINLLDNSFRPPSVVCVGRLTYQKGFDYALHVFYYVRRFDKNARFTIVGEGPLRHDLYRVCSALGFLPDHIFHEPIEDLAAIWRDCDVFFLPSRYEGFPNVLAEAMAHGMPSVAFDCLTGPRDLIQHGSNGFLCSVGDIETAAEYILTLLRNPSLRRQIGDRAMDVCSQFSRDKVGSKWLEIVSKPLPNCF